MKKFYIIHRWEGSIKEPLFVWLRSELEKKGHQVVQLEMPNPEKPIIKDWIDYLSKTIGVLDGDIYFIGHSIGCQAIMRYFETLPSEVKVGGAFFIAGWFNLAGLKEEGEEVFGIARPWIENPINFEKIKAVCSKIIVFLSSNEPYGYIEENRKTFENKLGAKVIIEEHKGHFTEDDGVVESQNILDEIIKI